MEGFVLPGVCESRTFRFLPCVGEKAGPSHSFFPATGPLAMLAPRLAKGAAEIIWSRHGNESENGTIKREAEGRPRACKHRFSFKVGFYAVFNLTLEYLLNYLLNFRDDIWGATATRGLTTWDLIHRAGLALTERAPRPSFIRAGFAACGETQIFAIPFTENILGEPRRTARRGIFLFAGLNQRGIPLFVRNDKII